MAHEDDHPDGLESREPPLADLRELCRELNLRAANDHPRRDPSRVPHSVAHPLHFRPPARHRSSVAPLRVGLDRRGA